MEFYTCVNLTTFCFYSACCPVSTTDGAAIGFRTKVVNFCLFTFNDDIIRQICFLMYENLIYFIIMLYYVFFLWNSCSILLIYSNMLVEKWFLSYPKLFRYCCPLKSLNVLRIIANKQQTNNNRVFWGIYQVGKK